MTASTRLSVFAALLLFAGACSTVPSAENMRLDGQGAAASHPETVGLAVHGGHTFRSQLSNEEFSQAVETSLVAARVFSALVEVGAADYRLDVVLGDVRRPEAGASMTTKMTVLWSLSRVDSMETVWQQLVPSSHTTGGLETFVGAVRVRMSTEGAARENIRKALALIAKANLAEFSSKVETTPSD